MCCIKYSDILIVNLVMYIMWLRSETVVLKVCGNCAYAKGSFEQEEIRKFERAYLEYDENQHAYLALLRRCADHLKEAKVLCRKENTEVGVFEEACALWKKK